MTTEREEGSGSGGGLVGSKGKKLQTNWFGLAEQTWKTGNNTEVPFYTNMTIFDIFKH